MIDIEPHAEGSLLAIQASTSARANAVCGEHDGRLKISVTQAREKGKANLAIVKLLCRALTLRKSQVQLVTGATSARKRFLITGLPIKELRERVDRALAEATG